MGNIKRVLSKESLESKPLFANDLRIENAEAVHVHWRDLRILMSPNQFDSFTQGSTIADNHWDGELTGIDTLLSHTGIPEGIIFGDEAKVEELRDGNIHVHWRDLRLELTPKDFISLSILLEEARREYYD